VWSFGRLVVLAQDLGGVGLGDILVKIIVDEGNGRRTATGQTFDKFDAEFAIGTHRRGVTMGRCLRIDSSGLAESITNFISPCQCTGERATDTDTDLSGLLLTEPWVEGHQFKDIDRLKFKTLGDPINTAIVHESEVVLPKVKERQGGASLGNRIMSHRLINFGQKVRGDLVGLTGA